MALTKERIALVNELIALAREKGYRESMIEILLMMTYAVPMIERVRSTDEATRRVIEFIKESDDQQDCLEKTMRLAGIE